MNLVIALFFLLLIAVLGVVFYRKKQGGKQIQLSEDEIIEQETVSNSTKFKKEEELKFINKDLQDAKENKGQSTNDGVRPESNQQRNLDRENGGLEVEDKKKERKVTDVWDGRSEEVDKMGSINQLRGTGKESMIWRLKKAALDHKKQDKQEKKHSAKEEKVGSLDGLLKGFDSSKKASFTQKLKGFKQDQSHEGPNQGGHGR